MDLNSRPGCIFAFSVPVLVAGGFLIEQSFVAPGERSALIGIRVIGAILLLVGGLFVAAGVNKIRAIRRERAARQAHPDEPWRWTG